MGFWHQQEMKRQALIADRRLEDIGRASAEALLAEPHLSDRRVRPETPSECFKRTTTTVPDEAPVLTPPYVFDRAGFRCVAGDRVRSMRSGNIFTIKAIEDNQVIYEQHPSYPQNFLYDFIGEFTCGHVLVSSAVPQ